MFWLQEAAQARHAEEAQAPIIVQLVNHYFGEWAYRFQMNYTYPLDEILCEISIRRKQSLEPIHRRMRFRGTR